MLRTPIYFHVYIILDFPIAYRNVPVICQSCKCTELSLYRNEWIVACLYQHVFILISMFGDLITWSVGIQCWSASWTNLIAYMCLGYMSSTSIDRATPLAIPNGQRSVASGCWHSIWTYSLINLSVIMSHLCISLPLSGYCHLSHLYNSMCANV